VSKYQSKVCNREVEVLFTAYRPIDGWKEVIVYNFIDLPHVQLVMDKEQFKERYEQIPDTV